MFKTMHEYYDDLNTSLFSPSSTFSSPPSTRAVEDDTAPENPTHLYRARLILENHLYDELLTRYKLAITRLGELTMEANSLLEENEWLQLANEDLTRGLNRLLISPEPPFGDNNSHSLVGMISTNDHLLMSSEPPFGGSNNHSLVGMSSTNDHLFMSSKPPFSGSNSHDLVGMISTNDHLLISSESPFGGGNVHNNFVDMISNNSPTSVINNNDHREERVLLPKSISVPSLGYFKLKKSSPSTTPTTPMTTSNLSICSSSTQDVNGIRLRIQRDVDKAIELDVYNQGMYKTELCNKWQQTNTCPYRDHCRFAHGLSELRPVIRHPRYKTQVCRMVLSGTMCPYGHRCHFRHST
ncbi:hypothetical protein RND81_10G120700 [Saponaria officinalis]|uniref:C3H1-type domain-containing protein n=1 Tax=Saponaria officinalis TaxID=3572 RepID=A0AAW1I1U7_SAPOF